MAEATPLPWMVLDPYWGEAFYATEAAALDHAAHAIDLYCADGGWSEDVDRVLVARVTHVAHERVLGVRAEMTAEEWDELTHGEGEDHDRWIAYELRPGCPERRGAGHG